MSCPPLVLITIVVVVQSDRWEHSYNTDIGYKICVGNAVLSTGAQVRLLNVASSRPDADDVVCADFFMDLMRREFYQKVLEQINLCDAQKRRYDS